jgi:Ca-activated chloride channel family protein
MPNLGLTGEDDLLSITEGNAAAGIYTTFIGIGVDFNTELVEYITKIKGANYYSVHSAGQFRERMDDEFEYMVTPLVFDLRLTLDASGWEIEKVYGSPEANESTGELMKVNTLFPSSRKEGETRGGLILLKLRKTDPDNTLNLIASYEDRNGRSDTAITTVNLQYASPEYFGNTGIRKGILLARYADLLKNWIIDEHEQAHLSRSLEPSVDREHGIIIPPPDDFYLSHWERQSLPLMVSGPYRELFGEFSGYFAEEMSALQDDTLGQELDILRKLS